LIRFVKYGDIDKPKWDECIEKAFNGNIYGYSWYLDAVCQQWHALVDDDYEAVFPLPSGRKYFIKYIFQPYFTQQLGIFSRNHLTADVVKEFIDCIPTGYKFVDLNLNTLNKADNLNCKVTFLQNHELDLIFPYATLAENYSENTKRNLKRAKLSNITVSQSSSPEDVVRLFRRTRGEDLTHLGDEEYKRLLQIIYSCIHMRIAEVSGAYSPRNELCAGAIFVKSHQKAVFLFSAVSEEGRTNGAMTMVIDQFIMQHSNSQLTLDFEGSNDPNLARFYKSFGAKVLTYPRITLTKLPWLGNMLLKINRKLRKRSDA
jgi:hypothetical protein